ncbi:MAG: hypothetical protein PHN57_01680 [Candidatus Omnitrophica bacterium]|nr:hypothetical protein [Candidatus Omnitrophota bacterium]
MSEGIRNIYDNYDFSQGFEPKFSNLHVISHSPREFFITFGSLHPPRQKPVALTQIILTKEHLMELILNLQTQLKQFNEEQGQDKGR